MVKRFITNGGNKMSKLKIGIIGIGHVGAHVLYTLALQMDSMESPDFSQGCRQ